MSDNMSERAAQIMREINDTKQMRGMRPVSVFLIEWANGPIQPADGHES